MTKQNTDSGFSIIEVLLIVVIIGILGFTGWFVYHTKQTSDKNYSTANSSTVPTYKKKTAAKTKTTALPTPKDAYLDLKEVGVKFQLNSSISDAVYAPFIESPSDGSTVFGLSTQTLSNAGGSSSYCTAPNGPLGIVAVTTSQPVNGIESTAEGHTVLVPVDNKTLFKIGNKYYHYTPPQDTAGCGGSITSDQESADVQVMEQSFTSLQSDGTN